MPPMCRDCERLSTLLGRVVLGCLEDKVGPVECASRFRWAMSTATLCCPLKLPDGTPRQMQDEIAATLAKVADSAS